VVARGLEIRVPHAKAGEVRLVANPMRFSATPVAYEAPPPMLGEHTDQVLCEVLGLDATAIRGLRDRSIV